MGRPSGLPFRHYRQSLLITRINIPAVTTKIANNASAYPVRP
jgi:hypothetical protein